MAHTTKTGFRLTAISMEVVRTGQQIRHLITKRPLFHREMAKASFLSKVFRKCSHSLGFKLMGHRSKFRIISKCQL